MIVQKEGKPINVEQESGNSVNVIKEIAIVVGNDKKEIEAIADLLIDSYKIVLSDGKRMILERLKRAKIQPVDATNKKPSK